MHSVRESRFAARTRALRIHFELTFEELSQRTGLHRNALSRIESGRRGIRLEDACTIADAFAVPLADMLAQVPLVLTREVRID